MAIDGQGKFLFILNPTSNDISMFQIDANNGALSEVPSSPFAVPPVPPNMEAPTQLLSITGEASGKFIFVGYGQESGASSMQSAVFSLAIDTSGSSPILIPGMEVTPLGRPVALLTDSKGLHLYVGLGVAVNGALNGGGPQVYSIDATTGDLSYVGIAPNPQNRGVYFAIDPMDRFIFAAGGLSAPNNLQNCLISPVDGSISACGGTTLSETSATGVVVESSGNFLYLPENSGGTTGVNVYSIDPTTGSPTLIGPVTAVLFNAVTDPLGPYIYSTDQDGTSQGGVHAYQVDPQTGNLTEIMGSPFSPGVLAGNSSCCQGLAISGKLGQTTSGPAATIFPSSAMNFTAVAGTSSPTQVFSIVNTGTQSLSFDSITIVGTNASNFSQTNTCTAPLAPNANCSVTITFSPPSAGSFTASLQVSDNAPNSPQTLALSGTGVMAAPAVTFSPASGPSFPTTTEGTSSAAQTVTVNSTGNATLHVSGVSLGGPNPGDFSFTNNCTIPVAVSTSCTILVVFSPIAPGQRTASLLVADDASGSPQTVPLSATATLAVTGGAAPNGSTTASISAGQSAQYHLQFTPGPGFSGTVSLSCTGAPVGALCQVPASVVLANGAAAPFTVTVATSGPAMLLPSARLRFRDIPKTPVLPILALTLTLGLLLLIYTGQLPGRNGVPAAGHPAAGHPAEVHLVSRGFLSAAIFCVILIVVGCGGSSTTPPIITPPGTSTITITLGAMSSSGQALQLQPIQLTLTVN